MRAASLSIVILLTTGTNGFADEASPLSGDALEKALDAPFLITYENLALGELLREIERTYRIPIVLDRRIDPNRLVNHSANGGSQRAFLSALAGQIDAGAAFLEGAVYLGPRDAAEKLRTLVKLRTDDFAKLPFQQRAGVLRRQTGVHFDELSSPREMATQVLSAQGLTLREPERIEHDLWRALTVGSATLPELLSLILIQFDLTWELDDDATIVPVPVPERVAFEKTYTLRRGTAETDGWKAKWPRLEVTVSGRRATVHGTVEQHEAIADWQSGKTTDTANGNDVPLAQRRFSLTIEGIPAAAVIRNLERSGIRFVYDADALDAAGIDLDVTVKVDVKDVDAQPFFDAVFKPLGLKVELDGVTVTLTPAS